MGHIEHVDFVIMSCRIEESEAEIQVLSSDRRRPQGYGRCRLAGTGVSELQNCNRRSEKEIELIFGGATQISSCILQKLRDGYRGVVTNLRNQRVPTLRRFGQFDGEKRVWGGCRDRGSGVVPIT
ncbi:hypothetical protein MRB53_028242 [Persea americana]|uniref:Uncharacterized protein n=1 Tax=Persea americana TaxID=3435 RepID=A0ACC2KF69_PERAE|nr:hypothetical protein MRB53_028242 [Persea americana]